MGEGADVDVIPSSHETGSISEVVQSLGGPYFQKRRWTPFTYAGTTYPLDHVDEYTFTVVDTDDIERRIAVDFSDHCFTRDPRPGDDSALWFPESDRDPGTFCLERYALSVDLRSHIAYAANGKVWTMQGDSFAIVPVVDHQGIRTNYGIVFSMTRVTGLPVDIRMRVKTAFPYTSHEPETFGDIRYRHLVALTMRGKRPGRIAGRRRRLPKPA